MKWTSLLGLGIAWMALALSLGAQPVYGGKMKLEATHATPGVTLLATSPSSDLWAAAGALETTIFQGDAEVKKLRFWTRVPQMAFSQDEKSLYAEGLEVDLASGRVTESPTQSRWGDLVAIAAACFPGGSDTSIVLLRDRPSKGLDRVVGPIDQPQLQVVDRRNGAPIHTLSPKGLDFAEHLPMALHDAWVAIAAQGLQVWNWRTGALVFAASPSDPGSGQPIAISSDGRWIVVGSKVDGQGTIWDTQTWQKVWQGQLIAGKIAKLAFSPDGTNRLALGGPKGLSMWTLDAQGKPQAFGKKLTLPVQDLAFTHDGHRLLVATGDSTRAYRILP
jgi:WD40 repeat protein